MTNPFSEEEIAAWERLERKTVRYTKRFKREAHYRAQKNRLLPGVFLRRVQRGL